MLLALRLGSLGCPVDDGLIRHTVGVVEDLENLNKGFDDAGVGVAVDLDGVDEADFSLGSVAEGLENWCVALISARHRESSLQ